jgi:hypothetical protein
MVGSFNIDNDVCDVSRKNAAGVMEWTLSN